MHRTSIRVLGAALACFAFGACQRALPPNVTPPSVKSQGADPAAVPNPAASAPATKGPSQ